MSRTVDAATAYGAPAPRDYQIQCCDDVLDALDRGQRALLVAPTGAGKTWMGVYIALALGGRALWTAHRRELIFQPFARLVRAGVRPADLGVYLGGVGRRAVTRLPENDADDGEIWASCASYRPEARIQVGSIQTVARRTLTAPDLVIFDEGHRALAASYVLLTSTYSSAAVVGLTATPIRTNGEGLSGAYDVMIEAPDYQALVELGALVPVHRAWGRPPDKTVDTSKVKIVAGEFHSGQLAASMSDAQLVADIVEHWIARGNGAPTLAFCTGVEHSLQVAAEFRSAGISSVAVTGKTPHDERAQAFRDLESGAILVLTNCNVATEGTDLPFVKTIIQAAPTTSEIKHRQQLGRASRPTDAHRFPFVILDHAGNLSRHGLPDQLREWSLDAPKKKKPRAASTAVRECDECYAFSPSKFAECQACGAAFPLPAARELRHDRNGQLVELVALGREDYSAAWDRIVTKWRHMNRDRKMPLLPEWCSKAFRDEYRRNRPAYCVLPELRVSAMQYDRIAARFERQARAGGYPIARARQRLRSLTKAGGNWDWAVK